MMEGGTQNTGLDGRRSTGQMSHDVATGDFTTLQQQELNEALLSTKTRHDVLRQ
jgi:hypothetical protein